MTLTILNSAADFAINVTRQRQRSISLADLTHSDEQGEGDPDKPRMTTAGEGKLERREIRGFQFGHFVLEVNGGGRRP